MLGEAHAVTRVHAQSTEGALFRLEHHDETVARVASRARASASPSSAVRAVLLRIRRAHWRWSAALSLFAAGVLFATQYGTLEGVRRVMSDGYVTRAASLASTSPTAAFASRASAP